ncbi:MAG TPA: DNA repair protein RecN [Firmicutes bacterium]|jgi:DNA repair protein RecN (Recombination protein N)|nr:DNA repair protein RecN [Bacillota bacterium]
MLLDLHVRDFVLINEATISWHQGLTVLTGETGAGKSIIIDALTALLGGKVSAADVVRSGAESALLEATFLPIPAARQLLEEQGIAQDETILVSREISAQGRSRCRVNGRLATVGLLQKLGGIYVDVHSQHESQWLLSASRRLDMLDAFGGAEIEELRRQTAQAAERRSAARRELAELRQSERERNRTLDILNYQLNEIVAADLKVGEDEQLEAERSVLINAEQLKQLLSATYQAVYENESAAAIDLVGAAVSSLSEAARLDHRCQVLLSALREVESLLADTAREIRLRRDEMHADPESLAEIDARLELIEQLKRKYGPSVADVLAFAEQAQLQIDALKDTVQRTQHLTAAVAKSEREYLKYAAALHQARVRIGRELEKLIENELRSLGMEQAAFIVNLTERTDEAGVQRGDRYLAVTPRGYDSCEFLFSANPGEEPRALHRVASGGELSRVMLALKAVLADVYSVPTLIFDEVDAGVGGRTAQAVAQKLSHLAHGRQVLCVTHLAQIAAMADHHILITKSIENDTTHIILTSITKADRVHEIARMLDGTQNRTTLEHARQMLAHAQKGPR